MTPFQFSTTKSIVFRAGAAAGLGELAGSLLGTRVLLVTDPGLRALGLPDPAVAALRARGADVVVFDQVEADPSQATLLAAVEAGRAFGATGVLGLGGG
ncbi:MAG: iron-containing alcohol dehydrogenase [Paracoccaceae bacterium]|nr:iron-containing alcohol dehydrogenase [Paracoccaceae bacterium]